MRAASIKSDELLLRQRLFRMNHLQPYQNRAHAARQLARELQGVVHDPAAIVLSLPRGGVPIGSIVASAMKLPLDILLVRKIGMPGNEEYAIGAIGGDGVRVLQQAEVAACHLPQSTLDVLCEAAQRELQRRDLHYRRERAPLALGGRTVILVDDGIATGASMRAAVEVVRAQQPACVIAAAPVGAPATCQALLDHVDMLVCPLQPPSFNAVGQWYGDFRQTDDEEVVHLLETAWGQQKIAIA